MGCVSIIKESCIYCEKEYSHELKYCPNCGSRNPNFIESYQSINKFKRAINNNNYFKSVAEKEIKKLTKTTGDKFNYFSEFDNDEEKNSPADESKENPAVVTDSKEDSGIVASSVYTNSKEDSVVGAVSGFGSSNNIPIKIKTKTILPNESADITCPKCGEKNDKSSNYCIKCGLDLKNVMVCPKCGKIVSSGKFCFNCGTPLKKLI